MSNEAAAPQGNPGDIINLTTVSFGTLTAADVEGCLESVDES